MCKTPVGSGAIGLLSEGEEGGKFSFPPLKESNLGRIFEFMMVEIIFEAR